MNLHFFTWLLLASPPLLCSCVIRLLHCLFFPLWLALIKTHFLRPNGSPSFTILLPIIRAGLMSSLMDLKVSMVAVVLSGVMHLLSSLTSHLPLLFSLLNSLLSIVLSNFFKTLMVSMFFIPILFAAFMPYSISPNPPITWFLRLFLSLPSHKVVIEWVPSHVGIPGNDKADHLARTAITHPHITTLPQITPELRPVIISSYYHIDLQVPRTFDVDAT